MYKNRLVRYIVGFNRKYGLSRILLRLSLKRHKVICGKKLTVHGKLILFTPGRKSNITIGNNVTINSNGEKYNPLGYSKYCILRTNPQGNITEAKSKPIHIKQNAFIGMGSIILKGVTIGTNSIIGAGSVVTKNVPDGQIWAGNPAVYIKDIQ